VNASKGALPLCLEDIFGGCIKVFNRKEIRVRKFEGDRRQEGRV